MRRTHVSSAKDQSVDEGVKSVALEPVAEKVETRLITTDQESIATADKLKADTADSNEVSEQENESTGYAVEVEEKTTEIVGGVLEIMQDNYGFLRRKIIYRALMISTFLLSIFAFGLRKGDWWSVLADSNAIMTVIKLCIMSRRSTLPPDKMIRRPYFDRRRNLSQ